MDIFRNGRLVHYTPINQVFQDGDELVISHIHHADGTITDDHVEMIRRVPQPDHILPIGEL